MADPINADENRQNPGRFPAIHPGITHFPIALFPVSAIFLMLWFRQTDIFFLSASYWTFMFAALGAVIAGSSGIFDYYNAPGPKHAAAGAGKIATLHVRTGVAVTSIALISAVYFLMEKPVNDPALVKWFALIVFLETILVIVQGFLGGRLVFKYRFGIEPVQREKGATPAGG